MTAFDIEKLVCSRWLAAMNGERLSAAEAIGRMALTPGWALTADRAAELGAYRELVTTAVARTGSIFVVDVEDWTGVVNADSLDWRPEELPPWPYPRCWIEVRDSSNADEVGGFTVIRTPDGELKGVLAFAVIEVVQAAKWLVTAVLMDDTGGLHLEGWETYPPGHDQDDTPTLLRTRPNASDEGAGVTYLGDVTLFDGLTDEEQREWVVLFDAPIILAQLLTTIGARFPSVPVARAAARRFRRQYGLEHPNIYRVDLRGAGDDHAGHGDRQFHHRWLVRGHYRKSDVGQYMVPGKGLCSWVRPYVKGPKGAPWKGRPIYTTATG